MDHLVLPAGGPLVGPFPVPPSKSEHQRCLALASLAGGEVRLRTDGVGRPGEDVRRLEAALEIVGSWQGDALG